MSLSRGYEFYSGNFTGILKSPVSLKDVLPIFIDAVDKKQIRGLRYFDATTRESVTKGETPKMKAKTTYKTKRRRVDFDHQISIFWKKGYHVKLFKTGKMIIPACGSDVGAQKAFEIVSELCSNPLEKVECNNSNIRVLFPRAIEKDTLLCYLKKYDYDPEKTKMGRVKCTMWWNSNYRNLSRCTCQPNRCSRKRKRGMEELNGMCLASTVMFGKNSATVFGTHYEEQRTDILQSLERMIRAVSTTQV
jgi:hypothetical protein